MCKDVLSAYVYVLYACLVPTEGRRGSWIPWAVRVTGD